MSVWKESVWGVIKKDRNFHERVTNVICTQEFAGSGRGGMQFTTYRARARPQGYCFCPIFNEGREIEVDIAVHAGHAVLFVGAAPSAIQLLRRLLL